MLDFLLLDTPGNKAEEDREGNKGKKLLLLLFKMLFVDEDKGDEGLEGRSLECNGKGRGSERGRGREDVEEEGNRRQDEDEEKRFFFSLPSRSKGQVNANVIES